MLEYIFLQLFEETLMISKLISYNQGDQPNISKQRVLLVYSSMFVKTPRRTKGRSIPDIKGEIGFNNGLPINIKGRRYMKKFVTPAFYFSSENSEVFNEFSMNSQ